MPGQSSDLLHQELPHIASVPIDLLVDFKYFRDCCPGAHNIHLDRRSFKEVRDALRRYSIRCCNTLRQKKTLLHGEGRTIPAEVPLNRPIESVITPAPIN